MAEVEIVEIPDEAWADVYAQDYRLPAEDYERRVVEAAAPHIARAAQVAILRRVVAELQRLGERGWVFQYVWELANTLEAAEQWAAADRLEREHKERGDGRQ